MYANLHALLEFFKFNFISFVPFLSQTGDLLIQLYHNFISEFDGKINQLKLAHFAVTVSRQYKDSTSAITFLEKVIEKLNSAKKHKINEPALYVTMQIAALKLQRGDRQGCKVLLEEAKVNLVGLTDVDPTIHSSVHWVSSQYYKSLQDFAEFYRSTLLYLSYTPAESLSEPFKMVYFIFICLENLYSYLFIPFIFRIWLLISHLQHCWVMVFTTLENLSLIQLYVSVSFTSLTCSFLLISCHLISVKSFGKLQFWLAS